jgi:hypothetical protein
LNTGAYTGGFTLAQPGPANQGNCGVALNGSTGYITIPDAAALRLTGDLTLEIWVKPTDLSNYWFLITKDLSNSPRPYEWRLDQTTGLPNLPDSGGNPKVASSGVTAGVWTHLAVTRSGTNATFYLNGSPNGTATGVTVGTDAGRPVLIGTRDDTFTFLKGSIAKPAIYGSHSTPRVHAGERAGGLGDARPRTR